MCFTPVTRLKKDVRTVDPYLSSEKFSVNLDNRTIVYLLLLLSGKISLDFLEHEFHE